jgi:hypothetical protein
MAKNNVDYSLQFHYRPLDRGLRQIRLVELHSPDDRTDPEIIDCSLRTVALDEALDFIPISYVWGLGTPKQRLHIRGDRPGHLDVGPNLYAALKYFVNTQTLQVQTFWIDAICINQTDNREKSWQVALMKEIYQKADEVIVWLSGPDEQPTALSPKTLGLLETIHTKLTEAGEHTIKIHHDVIELFQKNDQFCQEEIWTIINNTWFRRVWIQQEFLAAKSVEFMYAGQSMHWLVLATASAAVKAISQKGDGPKVGVTRELRMINAEVASGANLTVPWRPGTDLFIMKANYQANNDIYSLWDLLLQTKAVEIQSTDPRDVVFALLGLANDLCTLNLVPDYAKPTQECYTETTKALLHQGHTRALWFAVQSRQVDGLPSWVPDWSANWHAKWNVDALLLSFCRQQLRHDLHGSGDAIFQAGGSLKAEFRFERANSKDLLCLDGLIYDRVHVTTAILGPNDEYHPFEYWREAIELVKTMAAQSKLNCILETPLILRTLLFDTMWTEDSDSTNSRVLPIPLSSELLLKLTGYIDGNSKPIRAELDDTFYLLYSKVELLHYRRLFVTSGGRLGVGSANTKAGYLVVVFKGIEIPFLLREDCITCNIYNLRGEAYVDGIMYGELMAKTSQPYEFRIY